MGLHVRRFSTLQPFSSALSRRNAANGDGPFPALEVAVRLRVSTPFAILFGSLVSASLASCHAGSDEANASDLESAQSANFVVETRIVPDLQRYQAVHLSTLKVANCDPKSLAPVLDFVRRSAPIAFDTRREQGSRTERGQKESYYDLLRLDAADSSLDLNFGTFTALDPPVAKETLKEMLPGLIYRTGSHHFRQTHRWLQFVATFARRVCDPSHAPSIPLTKDDDNLVSDAEIQTFLASDRYLRTPVERTVVSRVIDAVRRRGFRVAESDFTRDLFAAWDAFLQTTGQQPPYEKLYFLKKVGASGKLYDSLSPIVPDSMDWIIERLRTRDPALPRRTLDIAFSSPMERTGGYRYFGPFFDDEMTSIALIEYAAPGSAAEARFVYVDDAAYSGGDLIEALQGLASHARNHAGLVGKLRVDFVLTRMAEGVQQRVKDVAQGLGFDTTKVAFHTPAGVDLMPTMAELFPENTQERRDFETAYPSTRPYGLLGPEGAPKAGQLHKPLFGFAHGFPDSGAQFCVIDYASIDGRCVSLFDAIRGRSSDKRYKVRDDSLWRFSSPDVVSHRYDFDNRLAEDDGKTAPVYDETVRWLGNESSHTLVGRDFHDDFVDYFCSASDWVVIADWDDTLQVHEWFSYPDTESTDAIVDSLSTVASAPASQFFVVTSRYLRQSPINTAAPGSRLDEVASSFSRKGAQVTVYYTGPVTQPSPAAPPIATVWTPTNERPLPGLVDKGGAVDDIRATTASSCSGDTDPAVLVLGNGNADTPMFARVEAVFGPAARRVRVATPNPGGGFVSAPNHVMHPKLARRLLSQIAECRRHRSHP